MHRTAENLEQSVFLKDQELRYVAANQRFCQALGRLEAEIVGKTDRDLYPLHLAAKYQADDRLVLRDGQRLELEEETLLQGQPRMVRVVKTPVKDDRCAMVGVASATARSPPVASAASNDASSFEKRSRRPLPVG